MASSKPSNTLFAMDNGSLKRGNGIEFARHQQKTALRNNLAQVKPTIDSMANLAYTKRRDDISTFLRLKKDKDREVTSRNEKLFHRLISIMRKEERNLIKQRHSVSPGPQSLNILNRK